MFDHIFSEIDQAERPSWEGFKQGLLLPLISELGARTYDMISGDEDAASNSKAYAQYLSKFPASQQMSIIDGIAEFLDSKHTVVRRLVLGRLNATFLSRSTALRDDALDALTAATGRRLEMNVLVDTNFLFSLIGLHDNPADDVVGALDQIIKKTGGRVKVKMYVIPDTIKEARHTIAYYKDKLSSTRIGRPLARAVQKVTSDLSGITLKFVQAVAEADGRLTAEDYFAPYIKNLVEVCRGRGVELYNEKTDELHLDQDVIDDVLEETKYQATHRQAGAKSYNAILHDVILWHFAHRKRPALVEGPADAHYWVATLDFGLLRFGRYKRRGQPGSISVAIHPTVLLQMLQFWVPQSEELEIALVDSLQPLLPHEFDGKAESVTIKILGVLSRYENVSDLDQTTLGRVILDNAVRSRIDVTEDIEEQIEVVESALVEQVKDIQSKKLHLEKEMASIKTRLEEASSRLATIESAESAEKEELAGQLDSVKEERQHLSEKVDRLEGILEESRTRSEQRIPRISFGLLLVVALASAIMVGVKYVGPMIASTSPLSVKVAQAVATLFSVAMCLVVCEFVGHKIGHVKTWKLHSWIRRTRRWIWGVLFTTGLTLFAAWVAADAGVGGPNSVK